MACLSSRAKYLRGSTERRRAVSRDGRNWHLTWVIIVAVFISLRSFFFQQLLAALLLFTVVFVIVAALIALFIGIGYAAESAVSWAESQVRSLHFSAHRSVALPADSRLGGIPCGVEIQGGSTATGGSRDSRGTERCGSFSSASDVLR